MRKTLSLAAAVAVTGALGVAVLAGGGNDDGGGGLGPATALAQAGDATAEARSGQATATIALPGAPVQTTTVRWDGDDVAAVLADREIRVVGGRGFQRAGDGAWEELDGQASSGDAAALREDAVGRVVLQAVRGAANVVEEDGTFRANLVAGEAAGLTNGLLGLDGALPADGAYVEVATTGDGLLRRLSIRTADSERTVEYEGLGEPQEITAP